MARDGWRGTAKDTAWRKFDLDADQDRPERSKPFRKTGQDAGKKSKFMSTVLNADPTELMRWHSERTPHEQQRFIQVLDNLYTAHKKKSTASQKPVRRAQSATPQIRRNDTSSGNVDLAARAALSGAGSIGGSAHGSIQGSLKGSQAGSLPPSVFSLTSVKSAPGAINVGKSQKFRLSSDAQGMSQEDYNNTLQKWIDCRSVTNASVSTDWTECSQMTKTSAGTVCSAPCTKYTRDFRNHARGFALNRRKWKVPDAHEPEADLVVDGLPEHLRLTTSYGRSFGTREKGATFRKETGFVGFQPKCHSFLEDYFKTAAPASKEAFCQVGRSMNTFHNNHQYSTSTSRAYDLDKNKDLYNPTPHDRGAMRHGNFSQVPLGNLVPIEGEVPYPAEEPRHEVLFPPM